MRQKVRSCYVVRDGSFVHRLKLKTDPNTIRPWQVCAPASRNVPSMAQSGIRICILVYREKGRGQQYIYLASVCATSNMARKQKTKVSNWQKGCVSWHLSLTCIQ